MPDIQGEARFLAGELSQNHGHEVADRLRADAQQLDPMSFRQLIRQTDEMSRNQPGAHLVITNTPDRGQNVDVVERLQVAHLDPPPPPPVQPYYGQDGQQGYRTAQPCRPGVGSVIGKIAGGALGAVLGHKIGGGDGQVAATGAGTIGGALAGGAVGQDVDCQNQQRR